MRIRMMITVMMLAVLLCACDGTQKTDNGETVGTTAFVEDTGESRTDSVGMTELFEDDRKWNAMWECWAEGNAASPYAELMTYQSEVNNGGHWQYFVNVENTGHLQQDMAVLDDVLSATLKDNLHTAYDAYLASDEAVLEQCDDVFFKNEEDVNCKLDEYAFGNEW